MPNLDFMVCSQATYLKKHPVSSKQLRPDELKSISPGTKFFVEKYEEAEGGHWKVHLAFGAGTWYIYDKSKEGAQSHWVTTWEDDLDEDQEPNTSAKEATDKKFSGVAIKVPSVGIVYTDQPIIPGGNFTWGEATFGGTREIPNSQIAQNVIALAKELQKARKQINRPFRITSWYRTPAANAACGGASRSQHLTGKAVDIVVEGFSGAQLARIVRPWWPGGLGIYPGNRQHILHLDIGPKRSWGF